MQTVRTLIRWHRTWHLITVYTVSQSPESGMLGIKQWGKKRFYMITYHPYYLYCKASGGIWSVNCWVAASHHLQIHKTYMRQCTAKPVKALQALHDTPPLCVIFLLLLLLRIFWHKKISMYLPHLIKSTNYFKLLSINILLKLIKGHNSVWKFGAIMCISHNMDHIYQCIKSIHYFLRYWEKLKF